MKNNILRFLAVIMASIFLCSSLMGCNKPSSGQQEATTELVMAEASTGETDEAATRPEETEASTIESGETEESASEPDETEEPIYKINGNDAAADESLKRSSKDLDPEGSYTSKEDVTNYLIQYGRLPDNFITKKQARQLGWKGGYLEPYAPGMCIGGDRFGNYEGLLPDNGYTTYYECDIDTLGAKSRGPKRLIFSDDGHIYYTPDHYDSFILVYGD